MCPAAYARLPPPAPGRYPLFCPRLPVPSTACVPLPPLLHHPYASLPSSSCAGAGALHPAPPGLGRHHDGGRTLQAAPQPEDALALVGACLQACANGKGYCRDVRGGEQRRQANGTAGTHAVGSSGGSRHTTSSCCQDAGGWLRPCTKWLCSRGEYLLLDRTTRALLLPSPLRVRTSPSPPALPCRVRGALTVHPTFEAGLGNMRSFFSTIQVWFVEAQPLARRRLYVRRVHAPACCLVANPGSGLC